jgi:hypothetical protein
MKMKMKAAAPKQLKEFSQKIYGSTWGGCGGLGRELLVKRERGLWVGNEQGDYNSFVLDAVDR